MQLNILRSHSVHRVCSSQAKVSIVGGTACRWRPRNTLARAEPEKKPDGSFESLFSKELQRRGLSMDEPGPPSEGASTTGSASSGPGATGGDGGAGTNPFAFRDQQARPDSSSASTTTRTRPRSAPPPMAADAVGDDQRQRSIDMVTEGLEGLIPRAKLLLQLGGSVFLGFLPFMLVFSLLFTGIYQVFGDSFLHGGRVSSGPPTFIDPERLLSEPTVDPYIPYNTNPYTAPDLR